MINILLSVLSIICLSFYDFNLNTKDLYFQNVLSINWTSIEMHKLSRNAMYVYLLYSRFIYRHAKAFLSISK